MQITNPTPPPHPPTPPRPALRAGNGRRFAPSFGAGLRGGTTTPLLPTKTRLPKPFYTTFQKRHLKDNFCPIVEGTPYESLGCTRLRRFRLGCTRLRLAKIAPRRPFPSILGLKGPNLAKIDPRRPSPALEPFARDVLPYLGNKAKRLAENDRFWK